MPSRKRTGTGSAPPTAARAKDPRTVAAPSKRLSTPLRFPLLVLLNLVISALAYSAASEYLAGDLGSVSRSLNEWWQISGVISTKVLALAVAWHGEYDSHDILSLTVITHLPTLWLLTAFYAIKPETTITSLAIDLFATWLPFSLLRPLRPQHHASDAARGTVSNRSIITDLPVQIVVSLGGALVYALTIYLSFATWLTRHLVLYFDGLRDVSAAYGPDLPMLVLFFIPIGIAAKSFLFVTATGAVRSPEEEAELASFDPETATLGETIWWNLWGYSKKTRLLIVRTLTLAEVTFFNTALQVFITVQGVELWGAIGWALVWTVAALFTGTFYWWVGHVDGVGN